MVAVVIAIVAEAVAVTTAVRITEGILALSEYLDTVGGRAANVDDCAADSVSMIAALNSSPNSRTSGMPISCDFAKPIPPEVSSRR